eukprot:scaffold170448_cov23-Tisochrysis_lutea.AAC.5
MRVGLSMRQPAMQRDPHMWREARNASAYACVGRVGTLDQARNAGRAADHIGIALRQLRGLAGLCRVGPARRVATVCLGRGRWVLGRGAGASPPAGAARPSG